MASHADYSLPIHLFYVVTKKASTMLIFTKYSMCFTSDVQIVPAKNCCLAASAGQISAVSETA